MQKCRISFSIVYLKCDIIYFSFLFWINDFYPSIERASLDGTSHTRLFSTGLGEPRALAVDPKTSMIYWSDDQLQRIDCALFSGGDRRTLVSLNKVEQINVFMTMSNIHYRDNKFMFCHLHIFLDIGYIFSGNPITKIAPLY